jgi:hypothetical protein
MRLHLRLLVAVTTILTVLSPGLTGPAFAATHSSTADLATVERLLHSTSMSSFLAEVGVDPWFDWSTDYCSAPLVGNTGRSFNFTNACRRHDFGYRNLQLLERRYGAGATYWNSTSRKRVDQRLLADMRAHCSGRPWYDAPTCFAWAETFYAAVRTFGGP